MRRRLWCALGVGLLVASCVEVEESTGDRGSSAEYVFPIAPIGVAVPAGAAVPTVANPGNVIVVGTSGQKFTLLLKWTDGQSVKSGDIGPNKTEAVVVNDTGNSCEVVLQTPGKCKQDAVASDVRCTLDPPAPYPAHARSKGGMMSSHPGTPASHSAAPPGVPVCAPLPALGSG